MVILSQIGKNSLECGVKMGEIMKDSIKIHAFSEQPDPQATVGDLRFWLSKFSDETKVKIQFPDKIIDYLIGGATQEHIINKECFLDEIRARQGELILCIW